MKNEPKKVTPGFLFAIGTGCLAAAWIADVQFGAEDLATFPVYLYSMFCNVGAVALVFQRRSSVT